MADDPTPPDTRRARLWRAAAARGIPLRTILVTVAIVALALLLAKLIYRLRDVVLLIVVAGFIALLLNPLVVALQRWKIRRRGWAVAVVTLWGVLVFLGLTLAFGVPLVNGLTHLINSLPSYVSSAEHGKGWIGKGWIGHLVRKYHVQAWITANTPKLLDYSKNLAAPALSVGKGALSLSLALLTIFILCVLLLLEGPKIRHGLLNLMSPERAERYSGVAREVNRSVTGYMLGNFLTSLIAGIVVFVALLATGVPFPFLWALWVALVDFLPMIGGALAGIPVVLFAAGSEGLVVGVIVLVVFLVYTQIENHILNPVIMSRTVKVNPLLVLLAILIGASIGSWIGGIFGAFVAALLAIPAAGAFQVLVRELWRDSAPERAGPTAADVEDAERQAAKERAGEPEEEAAGEAEEAAGEAEEAAGEAEEVAGEAAEAGQQPARRT
jgi:predicted PurR-regulated permease PerM